MSPKQWRIQGRGAPLVLDQTEARGAEKMFLESSPPLSKGLDDRPPPPTSTYLKVWIRHCKGPNYFITIQT